MQSRQREVYRVGDLIIDVGQQTVSGPSGTVLLPKLSFDLLLALVRSAPDFVSNDELSALVWPGLVITPDTVVQRVKLLREALGEDAAHPRYIAALRSRGYRIVAPVVRDTGETAIAAGPNASVARRTRTDGKTSRPLRISVILLACLGAAALLASIVVRIPSTQPTGPVPASSSPSDTRVAVLPFRSLSNEPADQYLGAGLSEMIVDRLATIPQVTVIASGSSARMDTSTLSPQEMGQRLGARYLVDGSAQREGDRLRVTAGLVDASTGARVWSTRQDRMISDLFAIQDLIATEVATELGKRLPGMIAPRPASAGTASIDAQLAYLQGRSLLERTTVKDALAAAERFETALRLDSNFAAASVGLFDAYMLAVERSHGDVDGERHRRWPLIERALALDPACGPAYVVRAIWSTDGPERRDADFRRGLQLDPSNGRGLVAYGEFLSRQGRVQESERVLDRAITVDPRAPRAYFLKAQLRFETTGGLAVEEGMRRVLEIDPDYQPALQRYAKYRWMHHGRLAEAARIIRHAIDIDPDNPWTRQTAAAIYLDLDDLDAARAVSDGTHSSRTTASILLSMYEGNWRRAGEAALSPAGSEYNRYESWGVPEAVRDFALKTGDYARATRFLEQRYALQEGGRLDISNFRAAACLAHLLLVSGHRARAQALLMALPPAIDQTIPRDGPVFSLRTKAMVEMLRGNSAAALATLDESFRADDLMQWWYTIEHDPLWEPLRRNPGFQSLANSVRARVAAERRALDEDRQRSRTLARAGSPP